MVNLVIYDTSSISVLNVLKLMGKHFIDPKSSDIFQVFPCATQSCSMPFSLKEALISLPF
jgi:hypothetical protein